MAHTPVCAALVIVWVVQVAQERDRLQQAVLGLKEELRTARTEADDAKKQVRIGRGCDDHGD